jgi:hypothetical protein
LGYYNRGIIEKRLFGTNEKVGSPHYLLRWTSTQSIKQYFNHLFFFRLFPVLFQVYFVWLTGCAVAFVLIVTFTVITVCRVHMWRSAIPNAYSAYRSDTRVCSDPDSYLVTSQLTTSFEEHVKVLHKYHGKLVKVWRDVD